DSARWIRDHSGVDDLVATNRHCTAAQGDPCDPRRFFVAAYSERQVLVEGWAYTSSWLKTPEGDEGRVHRPFWNPSLLAANDGFFQAPNEESARIMKDLGVDWLFVDKTVPYSDDLRKYATPRYETDWAWVLELDRN